MSGFWLDKINKSLRVELPYSTKLLFTLVSFVVVGMHSHSQFTNEAFNLGIDHVLTAGSCGGGLSLVDINGDGLDDLSLSSGNSEPIEIYLQTESGLEIFVDSTLNAFTLPVRSMYWIDYDNNGTKDLFLTTSNTIAGDSATVRLFKQTQLGSFVDVTDSSLIGPLNTNSYGGAWADYDRDGNLDLYLNTYATSANFMFHSLGDGTFEEVAFELDLEDQQGLSFTSIFFDADLDGVLDLYTANDRLQTLNRFYKGNEDGSFTDLSEFSNLMIAMHAMGVDIGDYDNDGDFDIYVTNSYAIGTDSLTGNALFRNEGNFQFTPFSNFPYNVDFGFFWGCSFVDYDYDRDLDLFTVCAARDFADPGRLLFDNDGNGGYTTYPGTEFMPDQGLHFGSAIGDLTGDGWTDIAVLDMITFRSQIWKNPIGPSKWLKLHLEGTVSNRDAIGSLIEVWVDGEKRIDQTSSSNSYASQDSDNYPFGLGSSASADSVIIHWPNGHTNIVYDLAGGMRHVLVEDTSTYVLNSELDCSVYEQAPVDLTKSFDPVNGVQDRLQVKWFKDSPQVKYTDEDATACDIKFWAKRNLDPISGSPIGQAIQNPDTLIIADARKAYGDGTPRSIFKWPVKFRADGVNNSKRADPNIRYEWKVRCACEFGSGPESPWSAIKTFNTPNFDPSTGIYTPPEGSYVEQSHSKTAIQSEYYFDFIVYPNPNDGKVLRLDFKGEIPNDVRIRILDLTGREFYTGRQQNSSNQVDFEIELASGSYFIELTATDRREVRSFVVD